MLRQFKPLVPIGAPCFASKAERGRDAGCCESSPAPPGRIATAPPRAIKKNAVRWLLFFSIAAASSLDGRCRLRRDVRLPLSHQGDGGRPGCHNSASLAQGRPGNHPLWEDRGRKAEKRARSAFPPLAVDIPFPLNLSEARPRRASRAGRRETASRLRVSEDSEP